MVKMVKMIKMVNVVKMVKMIKVVKMVKMGLPGGKDLRIELVKMGGGFTFTSGSEGCGTPRKPRCRSIWKSLFNSLNSKRFFTCGGTRLLNVESQTQADRTLAAV